jgi:hypothetical protein
MLNIETSLAATVVCFLLVLYRLRLQFRRPEESRSILQASEAHLAAMSQELEIGLASMGQGLMTVDAAGRVRRATGARSRCSGCPGL